MIARSYFLPACLVRPGLATFAYLLFDICLRVLKPLLCVLCQAGWGREGENRPLGEHRMKSNDVAKSMLFTMHAHTHTPTDAAQPLRSFQRPSRRARRRIAPLFYLADKLCSRDKNQQGQGRRDTAFCKEN